MFIGFFDGGQQEEGRVVALRGVVYRKTIMDLQKILEHTPEAGEVWILNFELVTQIDSTDSFFEVLEASVRTLEEKGIPFRIVVCKKLAPTFHELFPGACFFDEADAILSFMPAA